MQDRDVIGTMRMWYQLRNAVESVTARDEDLYGRETGHSLHWGDRVACSGKDKVEGKLVSVGTLSCQRAGLRIDEMGHDALVAFHAVGVEVGRPDKVWVRERAVPGRHKNDQ